jgi:hypothetical protein
VYVESEGGDGDSRNVCPCCSDDEGYWHDARSHTPTCYGMTRLSDLLPATGYVCDYVDVTLFKSFIFTVLVQFNC